MDDACIFIPRHLIVVGYYGFMLVIRESVRQSVRRPSLPFSFPDDNLSGMVGWCEGAVYLTSLGRPTDIGLQLGKACYPCSG